MAKNSHSTAVAVLFFRTSSKRSVAGEGAGDVFLPVGQTVVVEIAVACEEVDVPAGRAGATAGLVELPLLPHIGEAVVVGVGAEGEIEADAFPAVAGAEGAGDFDGKETLAVQIDDEGVDALRGDRLGGVGARGRAVLVEADLQLVVGVVAEIGEDGGAADLDVVFEEEDFRAVDAEGGADLVADEAVDRVVGRGRVGGEARGGEDERGEGERGEGGRNR